MKLRKSLNTVAPALGIAILSAFIHSCADDELYHPRLSDDKITIQASVSDVWLSGKSSRSGESEARGTEVTNGYKVESESASEPLYIFESVSDRFESTASEQSHPQSRGAVVENQAAFDQTIMGVYAYYTHHTEQPFYMENIPYGKTGDSWKSQGDEYLWPIAPNDENVLQFFAYSPYNATDSEGKSLLNVTKSGNDVTIHYSVPDSLKDQHDLLISDLTNIEDIASAQKNGLNLNFHHALTSVRFITDKYDGAGDTSPGMYPGVVTNVTIRNIVGEASYNVSTGEWIVGENQQLRDYSFKCASAIKENPGDVENNFASTQNDILGKQGFTLMMIPQSSMSRNGNKPIIEITFTDKATQTERVYTKELDIDWKQGTSNTYYISTSNMHTEYTFYVEKIEDDSRKIYACGNVGVDSDKMPYVRVSSYYTVYQLNDNGEMVNKGTCPAKWQSIVAVKDVSGNYIDVGSHPSWLKPLLAGDGKLGIDPLTMDIPIEVSALEYKIISSEKDQLSIAEHVYNYDLSTNGGKQKRNTANCYIISNPGTYRIPIVYGNAIKNDVTNESAFKYQGTQANTLANFVRHDNNPITNPWIHKNMASDGSYFVPYTAELIRLQSVGGCEIRSLDIYIDGNGDYFISFEIPSSGIAPANALIAVKDKNGKILWHWHLWITNLFSNANSQSLSTTVNVGSYELLRWSMGQLCAYQRAFSERVFNVAFRQFDTHNNMKAEIIKEFCQLGYNSDRFEQALYYQFGRKDPVYDELYYRMVTYSGQPEVSLERVPFQTSNHKEPLGEDNTVLIYDNRKTIGETIQNPIEIHNSDGHAYTNTYSNLWNNGTITSPIKTVYDPCPPGYMVPASLSVWDFVTNNISNISFDKSNYHINIQGSNSLFVPKGVVFLYNSTTNKIEHNAMYTIFWTGNYDNNKTSSYAFFFKGTSGEVHPIKNPELRDEKISQLTGLKPSNLLTIRPMKEP